MVEKTEVFVAHRFNSEDVREAIKQAMSQLEMTSYFADQEVTGRALADKLWDKIRSVDALIADVSFPNENIYFEVGLAIGHNKPVLLIMQNPSQVPNILRGFEILSFAWFGELQRLLAEQFSAWYKRTKDNESNSFSRRKSNESGWCHFGNTLCDDRYRIKPSQHYLVLDQVMAGESAGITDSFPDSDLRDCINELNLSYAQPMFLDEVASQPTKPVFKLCEYCIAVRQSKFLLPNLGIRTDPDIYVLAGLSFALLPNRLFWMTRQIPEGKDTPDFQVPTVMQGLDAFPYRSLKYVHDNLPSQIKVFLDKIEGPISSPPPDVALREYLEFEIREGYLVPEMEQEDWSSDFLLRRGRRFLFFGDAKRALSNFELVSRIKPQGSTAAWVTIGALCAGNIETASRGLRDYLDLGKDDQDVQDLDYYAKIYTAWFETLVQGENNWQPLVDMFLREDIVWDLEGMPHVHFELALGLGSTGYNLLAWRALQRIMSFGFHWHYWCGLASIPAFHKLHSDTNIGPKFEKWFNHYRPKFLPEWTETNQIFEDWRNLYSQSLRSISHD